MRRVLSTTVFEALGRDRQSKFGAHVVALMPDAAARDRLVESLNASSLYGSNILAKPVSNWLGLTTYLLKEATPQAQYRKGFRRVGGSIPLGELGGDRVAVSRALKAALISTGKIEPYQRSYAKRVPRASAFLAEIEVRYRDSLFAEPLPLLAAPQRPKAQPRKRETIEPPSLQMDYPPTVADLLASLGPTHEAIAERVGLSRPQVTNVIVGRFGVGRLVARRVLELSQAA